MEENKIERHIVEGVLNEAKKVIDMNKIIVHHYKMIEEFVEEKQLMEEFENWIANKSKPIG